MVVDDFFFRERAFLIGSTFKSNPIAAYELGGAARPRRRTPMSSAENSSCENSPAVQINMKRRPLGEEN